MTIYFIQGKSLFAKYRIFATRNYGNIEQNNSRTGFRSKRL